MPHDCETTCFTGEFGYIAGSMNDKETGKDLGTMDYYFSIIFCKKV
jgi:hypothetical protein